MGGIYLKDFKQNEKYLGNTTLPGNCVTLHPDIQPVLSVCLFDTSKTCFLHLRETLFTVTGTKSLTQFIHNAKEKCSHDNWIYT